MGYPLFPTVECILSITFNGSFDLFFFLEVLTVKFSLMHPRRALFWPLLTPWSPATCKVAGVLRREEKQKQKSVPIMKGNLKRGPAPRPRRWLRLTLSQGLAEIPSLSSLLSSLGGVDTFPPPTVCHQPSGCPLSLPLLEPAGPSWVLSRPRMPPVFDCSGCYDKILQTG